MPTRDSFFLDIAPFQKTIPFCFICKREKIISWLIWIFALRSFSNWSKKIIVFNHSSIYNLVSAQKVFLLQFLSLSSSWPCFETKAAQELKRLLRSIFSHKSEVKLPLSNTLQLIDFITYTYLMSKLHSEMVAQVRLGLETKPNLTRTGIS